MRCMGRAGRTGRSWPQRTEIRRASDSVRCFAQALTPPSSSCSRLIAPSRETHVAGHRQTTSPGCEAASNHKCVAASAGTLQHRRAEGLERIDLVRALLMVAEAEVADRDALRRKVGKHEPILLDRLEVLL